MLTTNLVKFIAPANFTLQIDIYLCLRTPNIAVNRVKTVATICIAFLQTPRFFPPIFVIWLSKKYNFCRSHSQFSACSGGKLWQSISAKRFFIAYFSMLTKLSLNTCDLIQGFGWVGGKLAYTAINSNSLFVPIDSHTYVVVLIYVPTYYNLLFFRYENHDST